MRNARAFLLAAMMLVLAGCSSPPVGTPVDEAEPAWLADALVVDDASLLWDYPAQPSIDLEPYAGLVTKAVLIRLEKRAEVFGTCIEANASCTYPSFVGIFPAGAPATACQDAIAGLPGLGLQEMQTLSGTLEAGVYHLVMTAYEGQGGFNITFGEGGEPRWDLPDDAYLEVKTEMAYAFPLEVIANPRVASVSGTATGNWWAYAYAGVGRHYIVGVDLPEPDGGHQLLADVNDGCAHAEQGADDGPISMPGEREARVQAQGSGGQVVVSASATRLVPGPRIDPSEVKVLVAFERLTPA